MIKQILTSVLTFCGLSVAGRVHAVGDSPGGPAVNALNFQTPVTKIAETLYGLHTMMLIICGVIFIAVFGVMFYSIFAHRKSKGHSAAHFHESMTVEIIWTVIPFLIIVLMALPATKAVIAMKDTTQSELTIKVTGYQWKWGYEYLEGPGAGIRFLSTLTTPRDQIEGRTPVSATYLQEVDYPLVVPVNKKIRIMTTADDVVHSWYVPAFGVKQDAFPGLVRETWFKADKIGTYRGFCTELCGEGHAYMPVVVQVVSAADYTDWVQHRQPGPVLSSQAPETHRVRTENKNWTMTELQARGKEVYAMHCAVCHQMNGQGVGPFPALDGGPVSTGPLDAHLRLVLHGKGQMPAWKHTLNDIDIASVLTYQRNAWRNQTGERVLPQQVTAARAGKPVQASVEADTALSIQRK
jgi:cytochrome c oxidase subunit II